MFKLNKFENRIQDHSFLKNLAILLGFTVLITSILAVKYYSYQKYYENGIAKRDVIVKYAFDVVDSRKTELKRREKANRVPISLIPFDDNDIKTNIINLETAVNTIRKENITKEEKEDKLSDILEIENPEKKSALIFYLLNSNSRQLRDAFEHSEYLLSELLKLEFTDANFSVNNIENLANKVIKSGATAHQKSIIASIVEHAVIPNLIEDEYATEIARKNARSSVKPYVVKFKKGDYIIKKGDLVTELKKSALEKSGYNLLELDFGGLIGIFFLVFFTALPVMIYIKIYDKKFYKMNYFAILMTMSTILTAISALFVNLGSMWLYLMPIPAFALIISIFTNPIIGFLITILALILFALTLQIDLPLVETYLFGTIMASYLVAKINYSKRFDIIKCGIWIGLAMFIMTFLISLFKIQDFTALADIIVIKNAFLTLLNGLISGIIALGILPLVESVFKVITPYALIELADHNSPLLSKLQYKAPGTYHHCMMVANLCEAAAEAIGADPILARVGAFYHDIGKLKRPQFFIENQSYFGIENPHVKLQLNPRLSKMVITSHAKDGVEMAREYHLPEAIINFIQQHHGDSLAGHFYNRAVQEEGLENVDIEQFRYPGPKPNMKETAILMLADAAESAVRSLKDAPAEEVEAMINKIITERLNDGQLSDSPLTLKDIKVIASTFNRVMKGMMHDRVKYQKSDLTELEDPNKIQLAPDKDELLEKKIAKKIEENKEKEKENKEKNENWYNCWK